ncbi:MAG: trypsin-like peptidase domain-containing protein [Nocardioides sp.]
MGLAGGIVGGLAVSAWRADDGQPAVRSDDPISQESPVPAPLPAGNRSVAAVAEALLPSTVQIVARSDSAAGSATGSGFVLDRRGHVVTNNHVVADAAEGGSIEIVDQDGNRVSATVVGRSAVYDVAVLYAREVRQLRPAALGRSSALHVGDEVVAFGSPLGLTSTVTAGIVSAVNRPVTTGDTEDDRSYINAIQTDAAINPGNSGGPLVDLAGRVVGVNSAIATTGTTQQGQAGNIGVGFAIPIEQVRVTARQILSTGEARYPVIGATVQTGTEDSEGARIEKVLSGTPAAKAGLRQDDLITAIDGERVVDGISLIVAIRSRLPGDTVQLTVVRGDRERQVRLVLDSQVG